QCRLEGRGAIQLRLIRPVAGRCCAPESATVMARRRGPEKRAQEKEPAMTMTYAEHFDNGESGWLAWAGMGKPVRPDIRDGVFHSRAVRAFKGVALRVTDRSLTNFPRERRLRVWTTSTSLPSSRASGAAS